MSTDKIWNDFIKKIKNNVKPITYNYFFKDLKLYSYNNSIITILVPKEEILLQGLETYYGKIIEDMLSEITDDTCEIKYILEKDINNIEKKEKVKDNDIIQSNDNKEDENIDNYITNYKYNSNFNPNYTFDTFVVGESNKTAYLTAKQIAERPGIYNPYFLYAKSGLGKTHLMHAIGNYIVTHSDKKVLYITAEQFTTDYTAIMNIKMKNSNISYLEAFREKYRNVDVLMIDDIQFLEHKEKTQIEFTNTFETLQKNDKQIIIASDKSINDYKYLEERLMTRFSGGLTEMIRPPEYELKKNIIKNKLLLNNFEFEVDEDVIDFVASNCGNDVRNINGALTRLAAYASMFYISKISLNEAKDALMEFVEKPIYKTNSVSKIIDVVAKYYNIDSNMIKGKMRKKNIADARAIAMYLCRLLTEESLERIGLEIGGRDHSTVIHSYEKISNELKTNIKLQEEIRLLKEKLS